jgi:N-methylhydantoinase A/oxoprolinase/acetone carboxylase beta subunit
VSAPGGPGGAGPAVRVAVDTGGTFTDVAIADEGGTVGVWKLP